MGRSRPTAAGRPNLIVNAIEAMALVIDRPRRLHLRTEVEGQRILVTVRDTGVGLPPDGLDRIFETFYTTKPQASAWDYPSVNPSSTRMAGSCGPSPMDDHGATFLFTLPTGEESMV